MRTAVVKLPSAGNAAKISKDDFICVRQRDGYLVLKKRAASLDVDTNFNKVWNQDQHY